MNFSLEEMNLMCIYDTENRELLIRDIENALAYVYDVELVEIMERVLNKLENLTNGEFSALDLYGDYGDDDYDYDEDEE